MSNLCPLYKMKYESPHKSVYMRPHTSTLTNSVSSVPRETRAHANVRLARNADMYMRIQL